MSVAAQSWFSIAACTYETIKQTIVNYHQSQFEKYFGMFILSSFKISGICIQIVSIYNRIK